MADPAVATDWPIEEIPCDDRVFMRIHQQYWAKGPLGPSCFKDQPEPGDGMSVDWSKYSSAVRTRLGKGRERASNYGVVVLSVAKIRAITEPHRQTVVHDPEPHNRSHSLVEGEKTPRVRLLLLRECDCDVVIHCDDPVEVPT